MRAKDLTLHQLLLEVFRTLTHLDSRLIRSLRYLLFRPGTLTVAYLEGPRKPYITPFQLFLTANILFFAVQSATTVKVFSAPLASHLQGQDWSPLARQLVTARLAAGPLLQWSGEDVPLFVIQLVLVAIYLYTAVNRVYRPSGTMRVVSVVVLVTAVGAAISGYRFLMFLVTLYGT